MQNSGQGKGKEKGEKKTREIMHSALSACIISLRMVNVAPRNIHDWIDKRDGGHSVRLDKENQNVGRQELLDGLRSRFETKI